MRLLLFAAILLTASLSAEVKAPAGIAGYVYPPAAFAPALLPYVGDLDRLITEFDLPHGKADRVLRENFGGDPEPEWLVVSPSLLCRAGSCTYALFDGKTKREIGRFFGLLIVLKRKHNGYPVIQTLNWQDENFSSLRTYILVDKTYQVDDEQLIGEPARRRLLSTFAVRR